MINNPVPATHCIKLGGSLLRRNDVAERLPAWLEAIRAREPDENQVLIVGGGGAVEWLRELDRGAGLDPAAAHWAAIGMMDANARAVAGWLPMAELTDAWPPAPSEPSGVCRLLMPGRFLREVEPSLPRPTLPIRWSVTSDSIAARIASLLSARLTLVKSADVETPTDGAGWRGLAEQGVVDACFADFVGGLSRVELTTLDRPPLRGA
ncbi:MAG: hypothetical protein AAGJ46_10285 [Planctomycetota bacterium]